MFQSLNKEDIQNALNNLGCSPQQSKQLLQDFENHHYQRLFHYLKKQRYYILDDIHQKQKQIDYIDYILYILKNSQK